MQFLRMFSIAIVFTAAVNTPLAAEHVEAKWMPLKESLKRLASDDAAIREAAANALLADYDGIFEPPDFVDEKAARQRQLQADLKPFFPVLRQLLESRHHDCRETAAYLLAVLGSAAKDAEPALLSLIRAKDTSGGSRIAAAIALLHVTPRNRAVLPALLNIYDVQGDADVATEEEARDRDKHEEASAGIGATFVARTLAHSGRAAIEVPTLVKLTSGKYRRGIRLTFMYALAELGADCRAAVPALRKLVHNDDRRIRSAAAWAVLCIQQDSAELPTLLKAVGHEPKESAEFQESITRYFKEKSDAVKWLRDDADEIDQLLWQQIVRQASNENPFYQRQAIRVLGEIGPKAKSAVPTLITAAKGDDKFTRDEAIAALKQIDPSAVPPDERTNSPK